MWSMIRIGLLGMGLALPWAPVAAGGQPDVDRMTPKQILDRVDDLYRGKSAEGRMRMKVVTEHWTREMEMQFHSKGEDKSLVRILSPKKEKGIATLRVGDKIWNYLPKVNRVIKVPSSMMGSSWMGSHFTNNDLVKESRMAEDYTFEKVFEGQRDGRAVIEIECHPEPNAAVVWGKLLVRVRRAGMQPLRIVYYDEDMEKARTLTFSDIRPFGDRRVPAVMRMQPEDAPDEFTEVEYQKVQFDVDLADRRFSLRSLKR